MYEILRCLFLILVPYLSIGLFSFSFSVFVVSLLNPFLFSYLVRSGFKLTSHWTFLLFEYLVRSVLNYLSIGPFSFLRIWFVGFNLPFHWTFLLFEYWIHLGFKLSFHWTVLFSLDCFCLFMSLL